jgi:uncharacterized protein YigA (DUF484 family)
MCKRVKYINARAKFCQLAINDNKKAAKQLHDLAIGLKHCRNASDTITALAEIFAVSERTIYNDIIT